MLKFIEKLLSEFRSCFTRTYEWFLVIISSGLLLLKQHN